MPKKQKLRPLTQPEIDTANRIRTVWLSRKKALGLSQEIAAGQIWMTQGAFSDLINARVPFTVEKVLRFAKLLNMKASELSPELCAPYATRCDEIVTEGLSYYPDDRDEIIAGLKRRMDSIALGGVPEHLHHKPVPAKNWQRLFDVINHLNEDDLAWYADILELRVKRTAQHNEVIAPDELNDSDQKSSA